MPLNNAPVPGCKVAFQGCSLPLLIAEPLDPDTAIREVQEGRCEDDPDAVAEAVEQAMGTRARVVLTEEGYDRVVALIEEQPSPTPAMHALFEEG